MSPLSLSTPRRAALGLGTLTLLTASNVAAAGPSLRFQGDVHGDVRVIGAPLAFDCHAQEQVPPGATVSCATESSVTDTAPDLYWRDNLADATVAAKQARTAATLELPSGATVLYARLYWAALKAGPDPDPNAVLDCSACPKLTAQADTTQTLPHPYNSAWIFYQSSADVTSYLQQHGAKAYRVTDVDGIALSGADVDVAFSAWSLVVAYEAPSEPLRNLAVFDGLYHVDPPSQGVATHTAVTLDGFLVPPAFDAKFMVFAYEGDADYTGDHMSINGVRLEPMASQSDNFFNSSRSWLGAAVSGAGDVPRLSGLPDSLAGYDLHAIDVSACVHAGDSTATIDADSIYDKYYLGGFVTSFADHAPHFGDMTKTVVDLNGGAAVKGDVLEYTIDATNSGNDDAVTAVLHDPLDPGLAVVPGSIRIVQGGVAGFKTDAAGDDAAEWNDGTREIVIRMGNGATASQGGRVPVGGHITVKFRAKIVVDHGVIRNQATLQASGASGAPSRTWVSDGDPTAVGDQDTVTEVGACDSNAQCPPSRPHCDTANHVCVGCVSDADCPASSPACQPDGTCGECSATNTSLCNDPTPICDVAEGACVACYVDGHGNTVGCDGSSQGRVCIESAGATAFCGCDSDDDCGPVSSGRVCDPSTSRCIDGCRGQGGNRCPDGEQCTSTDTSIGTCFQASSTPHDVDPTSQADLPADVSQQGGCACGVASRDRWSRGVGLLALLSLTLLARGRRRSERNRG